MEYKALEVSKSISLCHSLAAGNARAAGTKRVRIGLRVLASSMGESVSANVDDLAQRIVVRPGVRSGQPIIRNTRITVWDVLGWLASGATEQQILEDYPELRREDITAVHQFAYSLREKIAR